MDTFKITCKCGHTDDFDKFTSTPINGSLPKNQYQCPACNQAWRIVPKDKGFVADSGYYFRPSPKIEGAQGSL
ncbi:hypothetical protein EGT07_23885 [Herbaspirillum sp. HC18]|nr:hypothetical protein EGT07_23885 [Herbaspirillum sp. HC18]